MHIMSFMSFSLYCINYFSVLKYYSYISLTNLYYSLDIFLIDYDLITSGKGNQIRTVKTVFKMRFGVNQPF